MPRPIHPRVVLVHVPPLVLAPGGAARGRAGVPAPRVNVGIVVGIGEIRIGEVVIRVGVRAVHEAAAAAAAAAASSIHSERRTQLREEFRRVQEPPFVSERVLGALVSRRFAREGAQPLRHLSQRVRVEFASFTASIAFGRRATEHVAAFVLARAQFALQEIFAARRGWTHPLVRVRVSEVGGRDGTPASASASATASASAARGAGVDATARARADHAESSYCATAAARSRRYSALPSISPRKYPFRVRLDLNAVHVASPTGSE